MKRRNLVASTAAAASAMSAAADVTGEEAQRLVYHVTSDGGPI